MTDKTAAGRPGTLSLKGAKTAPAVQPFTTHPYDIAVFIGRMRPFTRAHLANIRHALRVGRHVVVIIGSAEQAPSPRTPFTELQVEEMLRGNFSEAENARITVRGMRDLYNNALWLNGVRGLVHEAATALLPGVAPRIGLVGHFKDGRTSDYLKRFKGWGLEAVPDVEGISATPIRDDFWQAPEAAIERHAHELPANVAAFLRSFAATPEYAWLVEEHKATAAAKAPYAGLPHKPTFHAADPVVIQDGCVLLIERDLRPGLGLLSLPGGFVGESEDIADAMLRSLLEKTKIKVPPRIIASRTTATETFSYPWRSERGRIISTGFLVELDEEDLPKVTPGKGAAKALWVPLAEIDPRRIFEDHLRIIEVMVALARKT